MERTRLNKDWQFWNAAEPAKKQTVTLPHDAMIYEDRIPKLVNGALVGFFPGGDYWYEKVITGTEAQQGQTILLEFGGVFMDSQVYLNDQPVGGHVYGYSNFYVDLSKAWQIGENKIRVFVHNSQIPNSRWYSGSGIYRPVYLLTGGREHILPDGVRITTEAISPAIISIHTEHTGDADVQVETEIFWQGQKVAQGTGTDLQLIVHDAHLWSAECPNLYHCRTLLRRNGVVLDETETTFGIRSLRWNAEEGLLVNENPVKLIGGCVHHTNGILGAFDNKAAALHTVRTLKKAGFNAVRGAHNPRSREFLEACDEVGLYVMEEFFDGWFTSGTYGYPLWFEEKWQEDLTLAVRKAINHPSVIMYSIGNEVPETADERGLSVAGPMIALTHKLDPSRPVTMGVNLMMNTMCSKLGFKLGGDDSNPLRRDDVVDPKSTAPGSLMDGSVLFNTLISLVAAAPFVRAMSEPKRSDPGSQEIFGLLDIAGYNYGEAAYEKHHLLHKNRVMVGTETKAITPYDRIALVRREPWMIGDFVWTAWDYLGECGLGIIDYGKKLGSFTRPYPALAAGCGMLDLLGNLETMYYDWAIAWGLRRMPHIAVQHPRYAKKKMNTSMYRTTDAIDSWTFPGFEGVRTTVRVASPGSRVKLLLNGKTVGQKKLRNQLAVFTIPYTPGTLEAIALDERGRSIGSHCLTTATADSLIRISCDQQMLSAENDDLAFIDIAITDCNGTCKPIDVPLTVQVEGPALLMRVGSGNYRTEERYIGNTFSTYFGRMGAVLRTTGEAGTVRVTVSGAGLQDAQFSIVVKKG